MVTAKQNKRDPFGVEVDCCLWLVVLLTLLPGQQVTPASLVCSSDEPCTISSHISHSLTVLHFHGTHVYIGSSVHSSTSGLYLAIENYLA